MNSKTIITLFTLCCTIAYPVPVMSEEPHPMHTDHAMVVSASRLALEVGVEIMREGGNAFDAAAATGFALAVTYPQAGNLGGGGFLVARTASGNSFTLDFRETAPASAHRDAFLDKDGNLISGAPHFTPITAIAYDPGKYFISSRSDW